MRCLSSALVTYDLLYPVDCRVHLLQAAEIVHTSPPQQPESHTSNYPVRRINFLPVTPSQSQSVHHDCQPPVKRRACPKQQPQPGIVDVMPKQVNESAAMTHEQFPTPLTAPAPCPTSRFTQLTPLASQRLRQPSCFSQPPLCTAVPRSWPFAQEQQQPEVCVEACNGSGAPRRSFPQPMSKVPCLAGT